MNTDLHTQNDAVDALQKSVFRTHLPQHKSPARHLLLALVAFLLALAIAIIYAEQ